MNLPAYKIELITGFYVAISGSGGEDVVDVSILFYIVSATIGGALLWAVALQLSVVMQNILENK